MINLLETFLINGDSAMKPIFNVIPAFVLAMTLLMTTGCASTPKSEGTGEYLDDSVITSKIKAQLLNAPDMSSNQISVESYKGIVLLSGFVTTSANIGQAVDIARQTTGVKSVRNEMRLR
jgi:osmotically-inducible protein OsmY